MNPLSSKPTYLDYRGGARNGSIISTVSGSAPILPSGIASNPGSSILLYVPGAASPSLSTHLSVLLSAQRIAAVHLIGGRDAVLKTLRTEVYTAAGRMRQDVAVSIAVAEGAKGVEKAVKDVGSRHPVLGALICEWDDGADAHAQQDDILQMETEQVEAMWKTSVLPLHTLLRNLLPLFSSTTSPQPFIYLDTATQQPFATSSRAALLSTLSTSPLARNITIGPASEYLVPAPVAVDAQSMRSLSIDTNGNRTGAYSATTPEQSPLFGAESPTKLWASWAAQYE